MHNSSEPRPNKPAKPAKNFPLFAHASGMWAKKIRGRLIYFTSWRTDPKGQAALEQFEREWPYLRRGEVPPPIDVSGGCTLRQLVNQFLQAKEDQMKAGELSPRSFRNYFHTGRMLLEFFGKERKVADLGPMDFQNYRSNLAKHYGAFTLKNEINHARIFFNYAYENRLIDRPVFYGQSFDRPSALTIRKEKNQAGPKLFTREELLTILLFADPQIEAMVLLALNGGLGNADLANLPESASDLQEGWLDYPRVKTEIDRRIPLWKETIDALREWLPQRPKARVPDAKGLVFLTRQGRPWVRVQEKRGENRLIALDTLTQGFGIFLKKLGINGRKGKNFYTLRHCFETMAGESKDQVAVDAIMGHVDASMAGNYRHKISDERLRAVVETVRSWLFAPHSPEQKGGEK